MSPELIQTIIVAVLSASFLQDLATTILSARSSTKGIPEELRGDYSEKKYEEAIRYTLIRSNFSIITSSFSLILMLAFIHFQGFAFVNEFLSQYVVDQKLLGIVYFGVLFIASDIINIPLQLYAQFGIEQKFGFNKMSYALFFLDKFKSYLIGTLLGGGILYTLFFLLEIFNENYWFYFWMVVTAFMLVMNMFYTTLFLPLFNKLSPLENGTLKDKINEYGKAVDFPIQNIFVIDGSKRSSKANAFFSGIGKRKKIVLYDTLINDLTEEEIVAVLAHEVGHFKKKHIIMSLIFGIIQTGVILFISSKILFYPELSNALGIEGLALHVNLIVFSIILSPLSTILGIIGNIISRKNEFEADAFARTTYEGELLVSALRKLSENSLSNLNPHPLDVFINYSHPPVDKRYKALLGG